MANTAQVGQSAALVLVEPTGIPAQVGQSVVLLLVQAAPVPVCNNPPNGMVGINYSHTLTASGGVAPYTWAVTGGALPSGLGLNASTGEISGLASAAADFSFTVTVTDSLLATGSVTCSISIASGGGTPGSAVGGLGAGLTKRCSDLNLFDSCLDFDLERLRSIRFPRLCAIPEEYQCRAPWALPWKHEGAIPPQAVSFRAEHGIVTPAPAAGNTQVVELLTPTGYDGLLTGLYWAYSGNGFEQGSGDIVWRVQVQQRWVKDLSDVPYQLGSPQTPVPLTEGVILFSGQRVRVVVEVPNLSGMIQVGASTVYASLIGFWWPR